MYTDNLRGKSDKALEGARRIIAEALKNIVNEQDRRQRKEMEKNG